MEMKAIPIIDGHGYIFDLDTLKIIREKHNIAGVLSGVLPTFPQQNSFNGLPLQLLPEEVKYLVETGEFFLVNNKHLHESEENVSQVDTSATTTVIPAATSHKNSVTQNAVTVYYNEPKPEQYHLYKYFLEKGYFLMPGLRFGCQFMAYPGDLMRYHSHYNALGFKWDEKFDILNIVNGGRLATSVKKCWVVGSQVPESEEMEVFSIEWAGFG